MSDEEVELTVEQRALEAAAKAAERAAAYVLYVDQCEGLDIEPKDALDDLSDKAQKIHLAKAKTLLEGTKKTPGPRAPATGSDPSAVSALAGGARVQEEGEDDGYSDEDGVWAPPWSHVILKVTRGNLANALRVPISFLAPDVAGGAESVIRNFTEGFMRAQQSGQASQPVQPNMNYGFRFEDGTTVTPESRLELGRFAEGAVEEDLTLPGATVTLVDLGQAARTEPARGAPVGLGAPVVIEGGSVVGRPVTGPAGPAAPQSQGQARTGPGGPPNPGAARV